MIEDMLAQPRSRAPLGQEQGRSHPHQHQIDRDAKGKQKENGKKAEKNDRSHDWFLTVF
jgi:hypothetical protein